MTHSQECLQRLTRMRDLRNEFEKKFPNFCRACEATGWEISTDSVPYGSTNVSMNSSDLCESCIGHGKCPRCGQDETLFAEEKELTDDFRFVCASCGYDSEDKNCQWGAPELHDEIDNCICSGA